MRVNGVRGGVLVRDGAADYRGGGQKDILFEDGVAIVAQSDLSGSGEPGQFPTCNRFEPHPKHAQRHHYLIRCELKEVPAHPTVVK